MFELILKSILFVLLAVLAFFCYKHYFMVQRAKYYEK